MKEAGDRIKREKDLLNQQVFTLKSKDQQNFVHISNLKQQMQEMTDESNPSILISY